MADGEVQVARLFAKTDPDTDSDPDPDVFGSRYFRSKLRRKKEILAGRSASPLMK
jgi:hypothetical protein